MNKEQLAKTLNDLKLQYPVKIPPVVAAEAKANRLVIVYGASDDLTEFEGAIRDEIGGPGTAYLDSDGLIENKCYEGDDCPYFPRLLRLAKTVDAIWGEGGLSWAYKTDIPHSEFSTWEDGEEYCRGIVFELPSSESQINEQEIKHGLDDAYEQAGENAYFGNGFRAGIELALARGK